MLPTCVPSTPEPTVSVAETASVGGTVQVSGTGWCHPAAASGGSRIAIKIDEGTFSHPTTAIHSNRTIWALVDADDTTGDWQIEMQFPDGTEATSLPAFTEGAHTLRLLTGSLIDGDAARSMRTEPFVVGEYSPGALPQPVDIDSGVLVSETRGGVTVEHIEMPSPGAWRVTVPGGNEGDWVFVNAYAGSSSRTPFPEWHRLDAELSVQLSLADTLLTPGELSLTVQSGDRGRVGELLGWAPITITAAPTGAQLPLDLLLIAGAAVVVVGAVTTALVVRAKRVKEQP